MSNWTENVVFGEHLSFFLNIRPFDLHSDLMYHLPENKIVALSKFKAFADNNFNVAQKIQFSIDKV